MILVYSEKVSSRLKYILNLILQDYYGLHYSITQNQELFDRSTAVKLNYSNKDFSDCITIPCHKLLFENGIKEQSFKVGEWQGLTTLFHQDGMHIPFDLFSATFYMVSRYEEYLPHIRDKYNRFEAESSISVKHNFIHLPLVNLWMNVLRKVILTHYPETVFKVHQYRYISTIDIDNAYAFRQKGVMRTIGGFARSVVNFFWEDFKERYLVLSGKMKDPYDTYSDQLALMKHYKLEVVYFFLLGDYGINDKNLPSNNKKFQALIKQLNDYAEAGIHPSFGSNNSVSEVKKEINRLSSIIHREVKKSRQHFLKLHFPETYQALVENGITDDYSMGFASRNGFRAGLCTPFYWYNIDTETETSLLIHSSIAMDATFRHYEKSSAGDVYEKVKVLADQVKEIGGEMITIWHNETMSDWREWKGWKQAYEDTIKACI